VTDEVATFLDEINELLDTERGAAHVHLLQGIYNTVKRQNTVSADQKRTVKGIADGSPRQLPSDGFRSSRRYEGWGS
jgi:hypothetical protein